MFASIVSSLSVEKSVALGQMGGLPKDCKVFHKLIVCSPLVVNKHTEYHSVKCISQLESIFLGLLIHPRFHQSQHDIYNMEENDLIKVLHELMIMIMLQTTTPHQYTTLPHFYPHLHSNPHPHSHPYSQPHPHSRPYPHPHTPLPMYLQNFLEILNLRLHKTHMDLMQHSA